LGTRCFFLSEICLPKLFPRMKSPEMCPPRAPHRLFSRSPRRFIQAPVHFKPFISFIVASFPPTSLLLCLQSSLKMRINPNQGGGCSSSEFRWNPHHRIFTMGMRVWVVGSLVFAYPHRRISAPLSARRSPGAQRTSGTAASSTSFSQGAFFPYFLYIFGLHYPTKNITSIQAAALQKCPASLIHALPRSFNPLVF